jgi:hypothetical protein
VLALQLEPLAARYHQVEAGTARKQRREARRRLHQMLEVVEQQKQPSIANRIVERSRDAKRPGGILEHALRIAHGRKRHPPDAARIAVRGGARRLQGEPRLPTAAGSGQR